MIVPPQHGRQSSGYAINHIVYRIQNQIYALISTDTNLLIGTVPTLNSCTKCVGSLGRIHDRTPDCPPISLGMVVYMTSQLILALIRKLRVSSMRLAYFLTCYSWALADIRLTGAGIKYLYCTYTQWSITIYLES